MRVNTGLCAICLMAAVLLVGCGDAGECPNCNEGADLCSTSPVLRASADDGEATLEWEPAVGVGTTAKAWQIRHALQGESWSVTRSTGAAATAYVASGLTNDKAYTFQVRAQLDATDFACWSAPVTVVPRRVDDVMEEIEKHQRAIAERMAEVVDGQEVLQALGEQGIATLEAAATSTREIAEHSPGIHDRVNHVATVTSRELVAIRGAMDDVAGNIGKVVAGLSRIEKRLGELPEEPGEAPDICGGRGIAEETRLTFGNDCPKVNYEDNWKKIRGFADELKALDGGLILTIGYATAIGENAYNQELSDDRARCASLCIRELLGDRSENFEFREVAKGEAMMSEDLPGTNPDSRRVDVILCRGVDSGGKEYSGDVFELKADECGCEPGSLEASAAEDEA